MGDAKLPSPSSDALRVKFPGDDLVAAGLADLAAGRGTVEALLVAAAEPRLRRAGVHVPEHRMDQTGRELYALLEAELGLRAHSRHNALQREVISSCSRRRRMRPSTDRAKICHLLAELGKLSSSGDRIYLSGDASVVEAGWREFTQELDIRIESEDDEPLLRAITSLKERLDVNVELASPLDFLPAPPAWKDRSPFIARYGAVDVYHVDFSLQALAKLERGLKRDLGDVEAMLDLGLTSAAAIQETFDSIEPELYRFPAIDAEELRAIVADFIEKHGP